jgi:DNA-binding transcriptional ArsR family regulator
MKIVIFMSERELNGRKIGEAISDQTRVEILQHLLRAYPNSLTMSEIERALSKQVSPTTISFHLRKLREAGLIVTNGHKKGFRALRPTINITINNNGVHVGEEKRNDAP